MIKNIGGTKKMFQLSVVEGECEGLFKPKYFIYLAAAFGSLGN